MTDDSHLLGAWRRRDAHAGNRLFERHFTAEVRFFSHKVGDAANDLTHRAFLVSIRSQDREQLVRSMQVHGALTPAEE